MSRGDETDVLMVQALKEVDQFMTEFRSKYRLMC